MVSDSDLLAYREQRVAKAGLASGRVYEACSSYEHTYCEGCGGSGKIQEKRRYIETLCFRCDGSGRAYRWTLDPRMARAARRAAKKGLTEEEQISYATGFETPGRLKKPAGCRGGATKLNEEIGASGESTLGVAVLRGDMTIEAAKAKAAEAKYRHEKTNYDDLLCYEGLSRDEAREQMVPRT